MHSCSSAVQQETQQWCQYDVLDIAAASSDVVLYESWWLCCYFRRASAAVNDTANVAVAVRVFESPTPSSQVLVHSRLSHKCKPEPGNTLATDSYRLV